LFSYESDSELFGFDYKQDLHKRAIERDRIYRLKQIEDTDDEGELTESPFLGLGMGDTGLEMTGMEKISKMITKSPTKV
jgi:hypothetical protein